MCLSLEALSSLLCVWPWQFDQRLPLGWDSLALGVMSQRAQAADGAETGSPHVLCSSLYIAPQLMNLSTHFQVFLYQ